MNKRLASVLCALFVALSGASLGACETQHSRDVDKVTDEFTGSGGELKDIEAGNSK